MNTTHRPLGLILIALTIAASLFVGSCGKGEEDAQSRAVRVSSRTQLIGGPTALGEVGDYLIENDKVRVVVQDLTYNRGSGVFGGSLIDADIVRFDQNGNALGGSGRDNFGELFPVFFLEMIDPEEIVIVNDGADGKAAVVEVRGRGGEFITMLRYLNQLMVNSYDAEVSDIVTGVPATSDGEPQMAFSTRYILEPGSRHVRIESKMENIGETALEFPSGDILTLLQQFLGLNLSDFRIPTGHVLGFGALSHIFVPGIGFDLRFGLDEAYMNPVDLPGFPGLLTNVVASTTDLGVNYGFATVEDPENNFVYQRDQDDLYNGRANADDMLMLFYASGFAGVFTNQAPQALEPGESYTFTNYFIIGDGDVASIQEEVYEIRGLKAARVQGRVMDEITREPLSEKSDVLFYTATSGDCSTSTIYSQVHTSKSGYFSLDLLPGQYCYRVHESGRPLGELKPLEVKSNGAPFVNINAPGTSRVEVLVTDTAGTPLPSKLTVVGTHAYNPNTLTRDYLFDLQAGEPWRATDMIPDDPDNAGTRRFIEDTEFGKENGVVSLNVRPGKYILYVSRGPEYALWSKEVDLKAGRVASVSATLERVVDTTGFLSGDFHMHAAGSIDSGLDNNIRVHTVVGEGLESVVSTDHNYVTDYEPFILKNGLQNWVNSIVGIELTTFEAGHFNTFPVARDLDSMSRGSIKWQDIPPQQIFDAMREMAPDQGNIIQVNHPRTPIMGYFYQHNVDPFDGTVDLALNQASGIVGTATAALTSPSGPAFIETIEDENGEVIGYKSTLSWDFDAIEVFNGKHLEELRHFRMPFDKTAASTEPDAIPADILAGLKTQLTADVTNDDGTYESGYLEELFPDLMTAEIEALDAAQVEAAVDAWVLERIPVKNAILCDGDDVILAGGLDDWYNMLNNERPDGTYRKYTATGNSDAHKARLDEAGYPRNYFHVGHDDPRKLTDDELVKAIRGGRNIVTNGPFLNMSINGSPLGSEVTATGTVEVSIRIAAADWVGADRFRLVANGEVVRGLTDEQSDDYWGWVPVELDDGEYRATFTVDVERDTWFVVEVEGDQNLFPVLSPQEIPPFNFDAVIGSLAGAFGFGGGVEGLEPEVVFPLTPFAFTNPIWVVTDGDGTFTPPNPPAFRCQDGQYVAASGLVAFDRPSSEEMRLMATPMPVELHKHNNPFERRRGEKTRDLRMLFQNFGHLH